MDQLNRRVWQRFVAIAKPYWFSEDKVRARILLGILILLLLAVNGLNVIINYVGGDFMTALSGKDVPKFYKLLCEYGAVFVVGTPIVVFYTYVQQKLGMYWRKWLTESFLKKYFDNRSYYHVSTDAQIDNPDERIHQDVNSFATSALAFLLTILSAIITLISFTAILWSISTNLVIALLAYAICGTVATVWFGRRLIGLNFNQLRREADFRFGLVHVRSNVESIAFYKGEQQETSQVNNRFKAALDNFNQLIGWQRNLNFLTTGYNYFVVIIPSLVIAPLYFSGKVHFGVITQADMAFTQVLSSLSIIVTQFQDLSAFIAQTNRLGSFNEALDRPALAEDKGKTIEFVSDGKVALDKVTIQTPDYKRTLVKDVSCAIGPGEGLLIIGASGAGKSSMLRTIAGLWNAGEGRIIRPDTKDMLFLPQKPYMVLGTLRSQLVYPNTDPETPESELRKVLQLVNLADLPEKIGGFETELNWSDFLSLGEQQRLAFARLLLAQPPYAVLDEATSGLDIANEERLYGYLKAGKTTYISVGHRFSLVKYHSSVLEIDGQDGWKLMPASEFAKNVADQQQLDAATLVRPDGNRTVHPGTSTGFSASSLT